MFAIALVLAWLVNLYATGGSAGFTPQPPPLKWHPAYWAAEALCLRRRGAAGMVGFLLMAFGGFLGSLGWIGAIVGLFILAPFPGLVLDFARRESKFRAVDFVFFNPFKPVSERPETITEGGRQTEIFQTIYLYISEETWAEMSNYMDENEQQYLSRKRLTGALFRAEVDSDFMMVFDSLRLNRFLVHPENEVAMAAFAEALRELPEHGPTDENDGPRSSSPREYNDEPVEVAPEPDFQAPMPDEPDLGDVGDYPVESTGESLIAPAFLTGTTKENVTRGKGRPGPKDHGDAHDVAVEALDIFNGLDDDSNS